MKKILLILVSLVCVSAQAQHRCATVHKTEQAALSSFEYAQALADFDMLSAQYEAGLIDASARDLKQIDIPVVVHVLYKEEEHNISYEQIKSQIEVLNRDFNAENEDRSKIPAVWRDLSVASGIRFHLADKDPDGNFTNGVTRTQTNKTDIGDSDDYYDSSLGGADPWPQPHYVNIWVCEINNTTLGFSILPSSSMAENDGIVMHPRAFGTMGTVNPPYDKGRTMVHEMGHYLGLRHVWGSDEESCTSTDYMSDTPWQMAANFSCQAFPKISCASEGQGDMFMNYMDYSNDTCAFLFTERQVNFMRLVLLTSRITLIHSSGYTGVEETASDSRIRVYPNPSHGEVHIEFQPGERPEEARVLNAAGEEVRIIHPKTNIVRIDLGDCAKGIYYFVSPNQTVRLVLI